MTRRRVVLAIAALVLASAALAAWTLSRGPSAAAAPRYVADAPPARMLAAAEVGELADVQAAWASAHRQGWTLCARTFLDGEALSAPVRFFGAAPPASAGFTAGYERCRSELLDLVAKHGEDAVRAALAGQADQLGGGPLTAPHTGQQPDRP